MFFQLLLCYNFVKYIQELYRFTLHVHFVYVYGDSDRSDGLLLIHSQCCVEYIEQRLQKLSVS